MKTFSVHGAPSEYIIEENSLFMLEDKLSELGLANVLIVHGEKSWGAALPYLPEFIVTKAEKYKYSGECSLAEIEIIAEMINNNSFDAVIGIGGGKVLDLVKSVSYQARVPSYLIPTLASNCSPWTPISVIYDEDGKFITYELYPTSANLVLVEPRILLNAPLDLLIAGIGDTLAKWYEADVQMAGITNKSVPLQISHYAAKQCKDLLLSHAEEAINGVKSKTLNDDFIKVVESIIMLGGMVGGFGDHYGRIAGAHSIHNGLTEIEETHGALHGEKVAYGILVQLVLEDKWNEIVQLIPFYRKLGLPLSLVQLGISSIDSETIDKIANKSALENESIHVMPIGPITKHRVAKAICELESYIKANLTIQG